MAGPSEVTVDIVATSQDIASWKTAPTPPQITMNGNPFPQPNFGDLASGWQLVIIDSSKDMTDPASVLCNLAFALFPDSSGYWSDTYSWTYNNLGRRILATGSPDTRLVFLASYGWDNNAPPTAFFLQMMLNMGAGQQLQHWCLNNDAGSESGWTGFPCAYVLIGGSSYQYGEGHEAFDYPGSGQAKAEVNVPLGNP